jgi:hypothetical protein
MEAKVVVCKSGAADDENKSDGWTDGWTIGLKEMGEMGSVVYMGQKMGRMRIDWERIGPMMCWVLAFG